jgi:hypothetical protein
MPGPHELGSGARSLEAIRVPFAAPFFGLRPRPSFPVPVFPTGPFFLQKAAQPCPATPLPDTPTPRHPPRDSLPETPSPRLPPRDHTSRHILRQPSPRLPPRDHTPREPPETPSARPYPETVLRADVDRRSPSRGDASGAYWWDPPMRAPREGVAKCFGIRGLNHRGLTTAPIQ